jgi:hypothetical protein
MRRPPIMARMFMAVGFSLFVLWVLARILLFFSPPTGLDRFCLNKTLAEVNQCVQDYKDRR